MKAASGATLAILAGGQYFKAEFYQFTLANGTTYYFTNSDASIKVGGIPYLTGLTLVRSQFTQAVGLSVQSIDLTIQPQADNPAGPITIAGYPFLSGCRAGVFDGCLVTISKGFFNLPAAGSQLDTSPGIVPWFKGIVNEVQCGRYSVDITVNDVTQLLNVQMPRNILSVGCVHTLFDAGCTLVKATFTSTGAIATVAGANSITTGLTQADHYFDRGIITFTGAGVLSGGSYVVAQFLNASGSIRTIVPFPKTPSPGDTFSIQPACPKTMAACKNTNAAVAPPFANLTTSGGHYRGAPFVPVPQTLYDGGSTSTAAPTIGGQRGQGAGSNFSGGLGAGTYVP